MATPEDLLREACEQAIAEAGIEGKVSSLSVHLRHGAQLDASVICRVVVYEGALAIGGLTPAQLDARANGQEPTEDEWRQAARRVAADLVRSAKATLEGRDELDDGEG